MTVTISPSDLLALFVLVVLDVSFCAHGAYRIFNFVRGEHRFKRSVSILAVVMLIAFGLVTIYGLGVLAGLRLFVYMYAASVTINAAYSIWLGITRGNITGGPGIPAAGSQSPPEAKSERIKL